MKHPWQGTQTVTLSSKSEDSAELGVGYIPEIADLGRLRQEDGQSGLQSNVFPQWHVPKHASLAPGTKLNFPDLGKPCREIPGLFFFF